MAERPTILFIRSSRRCTGLERRMVLAAEWARDAGAEPHLAVLHRAVIDCDNGPRDTAGNRSMGPPGRPDPSDAHKGRCYETGAGAEHPLLTLAAARGLPATQIADPGPFAPLPLLALRALIRQTRPALLFTQDYRSDLLALATRRLAGSEARWLAACHGHTGATPALRLYEALDRRALRHCDRVIGFSAHQCRLLRQWGLREDQISHIPHCIEPGWGAGLPAAAREATRRRWNLTDEDLVIGFFGRASPEKGLDTLLTAFAGVRAAEPRARLVVAGAGVSGTLPAGVLALGFLGDVRPALLACDLIAVPSRREAFGLVALEALALGRPVIASDAGGLPEIVRAGASGWLAPAGDAPAWTASLLEALRDAPERRRRAALGRDDVWARFPVCRISQDMIALYRTLL
jgi:glycosyltransferase involved in cell wall biosynthesis